MTIDEEVARLIRKFLDICCPEKKQFHRNSLEFRFLILQLVTLKVRNRKYVFKPYKAKWWSGYDI